MALVPYVQAPVPLAGDVQGLAAAMERELRRISANLVDVTSGVNVPYPLTAAETAALVTPTDFGQPPGNVLRYGAVGDSVTDDSAAIQKAINVARNGGGAVVLPASPSGGAYLLTSVLDCTYGSNANTPTFGFIGQPSSPAGAYPAILAKHTGTAIFDCTGSYGILWQDFQVRCDATTFPKVGWLLARNSTNASQFHKFRGISVNGYFSDTVVYNYGSEQETYEACFFYNNATGTATNVITWTANNYKAYTSAFVTIKATSASTTIHQIFGGSFGNTGGNAGNNVFYLEGACDGVRAYGAWSVNSSGQATVYADMSGGANSCPNFCEFDGIAMETGGTAYGVLFSNHTNTPTGWALTNWKSSAATRFLSSGALATLNNFSIRHLSETATKGINIPGTLSDSVVETLTLLVINNSTRNKLVGDTSNWTITTRTNDFWEDTGGTNKTFAVGIVTGVNGWTAAGAITQRAKYCLHGNMASFQILVAGATSIACTDGATITTLPFATVDTGGAKVVDVTAHTIGGAKVNGTTITMPAIVATADTIVITGTYFVA